VQGHNIRRCEARKASLAAKNGVTQAGDSASNKMMLSMMMEIPGAKPKVSRPVTKPVSNNRVQVNILASHLDSKPEDVIECDDDVDSSEEPDSASDLLGSAVPTEPIPMESFRVVQSYFGQGSSLASASSFVQSKADSSPASFPHFAWPSPDDGVILGNALRAEDCALLSTGIEVTSLRAKLSAGTGLPRTHLESSGRDGSSTRSKSGGEANFVELQLDQSRVVLQSFDSNTSISAGRIEASPSMAISATCKDAMILDRINASPWSHLLSRSASKKASKVA